MGYNTGGSQGQFAFCSKAKCGRVGHSLYVLMSPTFASVSKCELSSKSSNGLTFLELKPAAGLITSHVYSKIAFTSIKHSCDAVIDAIHDNDISVDISQRQGLFQLGNLNAQHSTPSSTAPSTPTDCLSINSDSSLSDIEFQTQSPTYGQFFQA